MPSNKTTTAPVAADSAPSYGAAAIAGGLVLILYLITIGPSTAMWDTSEYITAAYVLGLPHPPGNPFFVLIGKVFTMLPVGTTVAMRVNVLAAICSAASAGFWFLTTEHVMKRWMSERWQQLLGASLAALIGATAFTVWSQSVVNEKVYTIALGGVALVSWLIIRWMDQPDGRKGDKLLVLIAYLLGLGYANHMAGFIPAPAIAVAVLYRRPRTILRWKLLLACAGAIVIGLTPFATQPIRSAYFPAVNEGEPTACRTEFHWSCTFTAKTWQEFKYNFNREQFGKPDLSQRQAPFTAQVGMWWNYFRWQWFRDAYDTAPMAQVVLAAVFFALGLFGAWVHWRRDPRTFWYFAPLMFTLTLLLIFYLNFKYGFSQDTALGANVDREVRERDYFFIWSFSAWSVWAALGLMYVWESLASLFGTEKVTVDKQTVEVPRRRSWAFASPALAIAIVPLFTNWSYATRHNDTTTRDFAQDLLDSVEPYGILVTAGDNDTFPLWYAQHVEGIRPDVTIAITSLMNTDWYVRQLIRQPTPTYDAAKGPAMYRGKTWVKPTEPPLKMSLDEADSIPGEYQLSDSMQFVGPGDIRTTITPRILSKADIAVLRMIKDNTGRPIYFGVTTGDYGESLGFGPWLVRQGLARKLVDHMPSAGKDTVLVPGEGFVDVDRTRELWQDSVGPKSIIAKNGWPDRASLNAPVDYIVTGMLLSKLLKTRGDNSDATEVLNQAKGIATATRLSDLIDFSEADTGGVLFPPSGDSAVRPVDSTPAPKRTPAKP